MTSRATRISPQQLVEAAEAPLRHYGTKDWQAVKDDITADFVYDEVSTERKATGADKVIQMWKGWATAFPDSAPTIHSSLVSDNSVVVELTWTGTHKGALEMPKGSIQPTGKRISIRACNVFEIDPDSGKVKLQRQYFDMATMLRQLGVT